MFIQSLVSLVLFASIANAKDYIVGGQDVKPTDPIQASTVGIFDPSPDGKSGALCTGTLIRNDIALTAAHCLAAGGGAPSVIFGNNLKSPTAERRQVESEVVNPKWKTHEGKGMDQGDIALVKFDGGLPQNYRKISMATSDREIKSGSDVTLAGYGISNASKKTGAGRLRRTDVPILNSRPGKSEMILDQSQGHGACHGDSGGPAFIRRGRKISLAGVTNRGYPSNAPDDCSHKVVYTKVPAYKNWIKKSEAKLESEKSPLRSRVRRTHLSRALRPLTRSKNKRTILGSRRSMRVRHS